MTPEKEDSTGLDNMKDCKEEFDEGNTDMES